MWFHHESFTSGTVFLKSLASDVLTSGNKVKMDAVKILFPSTVQAFDDFSPILHVAKGNSHWNIKMSAQTSISVFKNFLLDLFGSVLCCEISVSYLQICKWSFATVVDIDCIQFIIDIICWNFIALAYVCKWILKMPPMINVCRVWYRKNQPLIYVIAWLCPSAKLRMLL